MKGEKTRCSFCQALPTSSKVSYPSELHHVPNALPAFRAKLILTISLAISSISASRTSGRFCTSPPPQHHATPSIHISYALYRIGIELTTVLSLPRCHASRILLARIYQKALEYHPNPPQHNCLRSRWIGARRAESRGLRLGGEFCLKSGHLGIKALAKPWGSKVISNKDILPSTYCR